LGDGVPITDEQVAQRWRPWAPDDLGLRLASLDVAWGVAGGWALDPFHGEVTRDHHDIEITVPTASFHVVARALDDYEWDVVGDGRLWPYPDALDRYRQTWLKDPNTGDYLLDVIREPHDGDMWIYGRDPSIRMPLSLVYQRTDAGIPFVIPEVVLRR
jgi:hypothetical protein